MARNILSRERGSPEIGSRHVYFSGGIDSLVFVLGYAMSSDKPKQPLTGEQKKARAKELCRKLLIVPHASHCVPSRCNCYLADIKELLELLK
jgi:hypothetical protein